MLPSCIHSNKIPETVLTKISVHIFNAMPMGSRRCKRLLTATVMGMHQARAMPKDANPMVTQLIIINTFAINPSVFWSELLFIAQPHFTHTVAFASTAAPQCVQYFVFVLQPQPGQTTASSSSCVPHFVQYFIVFSFIFIERFLFETLRQICFSLR